MQLMGIKSGASWTRGPEEKDPLFQKPKRVKTEARTERQRKGGLARRDCGASGPNGESRPVQQPQGMVLGMQCRSLQPCDQVGSHTVVRESEWLAAGWGGLRRAPEGELEGVRARRIRARGDPFPFLLSGMTGCGKSRLWMPTWLIMSPSQLSLPGNFLWERLG